MTYSKAKEYFISYIISYVWDHKKNMIVNLATRIVTLLAYFGGCESSPARAGWVFVIASRGA